MQNKPEFIKTIAQIGEITQKEAEAILELVIASTVAALQTDGGVKLNGVGEVTVIEKGATAGVLNGKQWTKPASKTVKAKISKAFIKETLGE